MQHKASTSIQYFTPPVYTSITETDQVENTPESDLPPQPEEEEIAFTINTDQDVVSTSNPFALTVKIQNNSSSALQNLKYEDELEAGVEFVSDAADVVSYNSRSRLVTYPIDAIKPGETLTFSYHLQLTSLKGNNLFVLTAVINRGLFKTKLFAETFISTATSGLTSASKIDVANPDGGWMNMGRVQVYLQEGEVAQNTILTATEVQKYKNGPQKQFELGAYQTGNISTNLLGNFSDQKTSITSSQSIEFDQSAFIQFDFSAVMKLENIPAGKEPFVAVYDEDAKVWVKVPILDEDYDNNTLTVEAKHFSTWGIGLGSTMPQNGANVLLFDQPYSSLFTGSSRYEIPITIPSGRAGFQPDISLSYSSSKMDGILGDVQAAWVGMGWNIDDTEIVRKITTTSDGYGYVNSFVLTLNGTKYDLIRDSENINRYYVKRDGFIYVERHSTSLQNGGSPNNATSEWWEVVTTDGTRYRLGYNTDSEQLALMYGYSCTVGGNTCLTPNGAYASLGYAGNATNLVARRWRVDRITDTHGNYIAYTYQEYQPASSSLVPAFDRESYLKTISYTGYTDPDGNTQNDLEPGYQIRFNLANRSTIGDIPNLFYVWDTYDTKYLDSIEICLNACDAQNHTVVRTYDLGFSLAAAPNTNGTLVLSNIVISGGGYSENGSAIPATASPKISFTYSNLANRATASGQDSFTYPRLTSIDNGYGGVLTYTYGNDGRSSSSWYNYRVSSAVVDSGLGTADKKSYAYTTPVYVGVGTDTTLGELIGYTTTTESSLNYNSSDAVILAVSHTYGTSGLEIGNELSTQWANSSGTVLQKKLYTYSTDNSEAPCDGWNYRYLSQSENFILSGSSLVRTTRNVYYRDPATGSLLYQVDYLGSNLYRKTYYEYQSNPDSDVYILDKPYRKVVVNASNQTYSETRYRYDGNDGGQVTAPTRGDLTLTQVLTGSSKQTVDTAYVYDAYGNVIETHQYSSYGTLNTPPSGSASVSEFGYDSTLHTYQTSATNALGETTQTHYLLTLGLANQATDANGWSTSTAYDGLGRTLSTTPAGLSQAGVVYSYPTLNVNSKVTSPFAIEMQILDTYAGSYRTVWGIYDGLGRILQNQIYDADQSQLLVTSQDFTETGQTKRESSSYYVAGIGGIYQTPSWTSVSNTSYVYDVLDRVTSVTAPGSLTSTTAYSGLTTTLTDPNGNLKTQTYDGLGRMTQVQEYSGSSVYATTQYAYDVLDRLTSVTDAYGDQTTLQYNWLGQKTGMSDMDMGDWTYSYDPNGNLISQTDARAQTITLTYDSLNRLLQKVDANNSIPLVTNVYGSSAGTYGKRVSMTDTSGSTQWAYSNYGRTVTETRTISGNTKAYTSSADWLGRTLQITNPDGESVTYSYDALGRERSIASSQNGGANLATLGYNALSQLLNVSYANNVSISNTYNAAQRLSTRLAVNGDSTSLINYAYTYDNNGNITQITDAKLGETLTYTYDSLNRLTAAEDVSGSDTLYDQVYVYDKVGNIMQMGAQPIASLIDADRQLAANGGLSDQSSQAGVSLVSYKIPASVLRDEVNTDTPTVTETPTVSETPVPTNTDTSTPISTNTPATTSTSFSTSTSTSSVTPTLTPTMGLTNGLVGYWTLDSITSSQALDSSGQSHTGTVATGVTLSANSHTGYAVSFDGTNGYISVPYHSDFSPSGSFSISAWINPTQITSSQVTRIIEKTDAYSLIFTEDGYLQFRVEGLSPAYVTGPKIPVNQWTYVVATFDSTTMQLTLYLNGELISSVSVSGTKTTNSNGLYFGSSSSSYRFNGLMDEVKFYTRVLTNNEIGYLSITSTPTLSPTPTSTFTPSITPSASPTITLTPIPGLITYSSQPDETSGLDTWFQDHFTYVNGATSSFFKIGLSDETKYWQSNRGLLKFDLSSIPSNAIVTSATLYLYLESKSSSNNVTLNVYRSKRNWSESSAAWAIYSTGNAWATAGGSGSSDRESSTIGTLSLLSTESLGQKAISLSPSMVQQWIAGTFTNNGMHLEIDGYPLRVYYFTSSSGTTSANRPKLVVNYYLQTPTPTITPSPTITVTPILSNSSSWGTGSDGSLTVASGASYNISTQNNGTRTCADGGDGVSYSVTALTDGYATLSSSPSTGCLSPNDEILLINMQGSTTSTVNTGTYEFLRVQKVVGSTAYFTTSKTKYYGETEYMDNNIGTSSGQQKVVVQRVPNYSDVTVNGTLTTTSWNGYKYGLLAFRASGTLSGSGTITATSLGYANGAGGYASIGGQGESYAGTGSKAIAANYGGGGGGAYGGYNGSGAGYATVGGGGYSGSSYGDLELTKLFMGSGGGGGGSRYNSDKSTYQPGGQGGVGGGIIYLLANQINWSGTLTSISTGAGVAESEAYGGGGSGGSIRIEAADVYGTSTLTVAGGSGIPYVGSAGRTAIYYEGTYASSMVPAYLENRNARQADTIFGSGFETGDLSEWSSSATDSGQLSVEETANWTPHILQAVIDDANDLYVQDDSPSAEKEFHARFYLNPYGLSMGAADVADVYYAYTGTEPRFSIQVQRPEEEYQVRVGIRDDSGNWSYPSDWLSIQNTWNSLEVTYSVVNSVGNLKLLVNSTDLQTVSATFGANRGIDAARMGIMGIDADTSGTAAFDDYESRRFSAIGSLPDVGIYLEGLPWGNGADGDITINSGVTKTLASDQLAAGRYCSGGGDGLAYSITELKPGSATLSETVNGGCLVAGDEVLLINVQGSTTSTTNVGTYEFLRVLSVDANKVYFTTPKSNFYGESSGLDDNIGVSSGQQNVILQRVPNYRNVTINGTLTTSVWNGLKNGIIVFRVSGTLSGSGTITVTSLGYTNGAGGLTHVAGAQGESYGGPGSYATAANFGGGGGGAYGSYHGSGAGYANYGSGSAGGSSYGTVTLSKLYMGSGGGGGGGRWYSGNSTYQCGGQGGKGGGIIYLLANQIDWSGTMTSVSTGAGVAESEAYGGGGSGGSIRIEGNTISGTGSLSVAGGSSYYSGSAGRSAIYYTTSYSSSMTPNYLENASLHAADSIFSSGFESGDLGEWSSAADNSGSLAAAQSASYWGYYGLGALIASNTDQYVQDDTPNGERQFHGRFYLDPNSLTMASGDILDLYTGYTGTIAAFVAQMQKSSSTFQVRIGARNDSGTWTYSSWQSISDGWNSLEVEYTTGNLTGQMILYVAGSAVQTLSSIDNDGSTLDSVRLGAMGIEAGTRGTLYFDDYASRRFSKIGVLADPGIHESALSLIDNWVNKIYEYADEAHKHAVTRVVVTDEDDQQSVNTYRYDANGNMTCRSENEATYYQSYNAENKMSGVTLVDGDCDDPGNTLKTWGFTYDGDGNKVMQVVAEGTSVLTTLYFEGGSYEVQTDGVNTVVKNYYTLAGMTVAMRVGTDWTYFLTDHLGSLVATTDATGALSAETRYMPFGEVRTDVGTISSTDYGYTFQRAMSDTGLMDYKARSYDPWLGRFIQPDSIVSDFTNPQSLNRYSYVGNRLINFNDPTGHKACEDQYGCVGKKEKPSTLITVKDIASTFNITFTGNWNIMNQWAVVKAAMDVGEKLSKTRGINESSSEAFNAVFNNIVFNWNNCGNNCGTGGRTLSAHEIDFYSMSSFYESRIKNVVHELGHTYDMAYNPSSKLSIDYVVNRDLILRPNPSSSELLWQQHPFDANENLTSDQATGEAFADIYIAWVYDAWNITDSKIRDNAIVWTQSHIY